MKYDAEKDALKIAKLLQITEEPQVKLILSSLRLAYIYGKVEYQQSKLDTKAENDES